MYRNRRDVTAGGARFNSRGVQGVGKYPGLVVRVAGYCAYFDDLPDSLKDEILSEEDPCLVERPHADRCGVGFSFHHDDFSDPVHFLHFLFANCSVIP